MKKIVISLLVITAVAVPATSAAWAYFSSQGQILGNTVSTGTLEIRVNSQPTVLGAGFTAIAPGVLYQSPDYHINNYGPPWFMSGSSNLTAKTLLLNIQKQEDQNFSNDLWNEVYVKIEVNRGWPSWQQSYWGKLKDLANADLLHPNWSSLVPGDSEMFRYTVWLPETQSVQNSLMGKSVKWDFLIEGRTN